ncbi:hypothetical protein [Mucilaginibacter paludis]|uniref:Uncharacterized protein n=1 Tax=Mucilaginibacter paludis DSM 18603 TaxID=714943 RepID=H1Y0Q3_9SPHI|nr:hypothetical protein [Mucilaginibacter paludis]EHQ28793.1 hypothetical protein Mucpa_4708 [Mucilaginibacter paludis DSM 18603]
MSKKTLIYLLLFIPVLSFAQTEVASLKEFASDVKQLTTTLRLSDKVYVTEVNTDNQHFDLTAIDDKMNILWKTTLDGYSLTLGNFKGKIIAVASTDFGSIKSKNNTYKGYLIDPATGKVTLSKIIYDNQQEYQESPYFFHAEDGSIFKLAVRQTNLKRKLHVGFAGFSSVDADASETKDIVVMDFDEQLQAVNTFHPAISDDVFITMACNYSGTLFIAWYRKDGNVNVLSYPQGKTQPAAQINQSIEIHNGDSKKTAAKYFEFYPSVENQNVLYYSILYKNLDNDPELTVSKLDFTKNTKNAVTEVFNKKHIKEIEKAYEPINKKLDKPESISGKLLVVRSIKEENDRLLVFMSSRVVTASATFSYGVWTTEGSMLINGYDLNLNAKYHQIFPSHYTNTGLFLSTGYHKEKNTLHVISNFETSASLYGSMDLTTGQWQSMSLIPKKKLSSYDYIQSSDVLWYPNGFIIPYLKLRGLMRTSRDIALQQIAY